MVARRALLGLGAIGGGGGLVGESIQILSLTEWSLSLLALSNGMNLQQTEIYIQFTINNTLVLMNDEISRGRPLLLHY